MAAKAKRSKRATDQQRAADFDGAPGGALGGDRSETPAAEPPPKKVKWSCAECTFINSAAAKKCKVCETPNPNRTAGAAKGVAAAAAQQEMLATSGSQRGKANGVGGGDDARRKGKDRPTSKVRACTACHMRKPPRGPSNAAVLRMPRLPAADPVTNGALTICAGWLLSRD